MSDESWIQRSHWGNFAFEVKDRVGSDSTGLSVYGVDRHEGLTGETKYVAASLDRYHKLIEPRIVCLQSHEAKHRLNWIL